MSYTTYRTRRVWYDGSQKMPKPKLSNMARELDRDLRAVRQIINRPIEALIESGGLTGPQQSAMQVLVESDGLSLKDLSKELGLAHSTVSGIVDRLERRGLVRRETDPRDRRATVIVPTEAVRTYVEGAAALHRPEPLVEALRRTSAEDRARIMAGLSALRSALEQDQAP